MSSKVRIAIIGAGAVSDYHHVPGIRLDPREELVAACDPERGAIGETVDRLGTDPHHDLLRSDRRRPGDRCGDHRHSQ